MAAEGRSGLLGSTHALCILQCFLMLLSAWTYNFSLHNKGNLIGLNNGEHTKLYYFGHGHAILHSIWPSKSLCKNDTNSVIRSTSRQDRARASKVIMVLILLAGDIHVNPGPTLKHQVSSVEVMPDTGEAAQVIPPLTTPAHHTVELEEMLAQCQELPEQRHAGKWSASEPHVRTSDRDHTGVTPPDRSPSEDWTGGYYGCGGRRGLSFSVGRQSNGYSYSRA